MKRKIKEESRQTKRREWLDSIVRFCYACGRQFPGGNPYRPPYLIVRDDYMLCDICDLMCPSTSYFGICYGEWPYVYSSLELKR